VAFVVCGVIKMDKEQIKDAIKSQKKWEHILPESVVDWYLPISNPLSGRIVLNGMFMEIKDFPQCEEYVSALINAFELCDSDREKDFNLRVTVGAKAAKRRINYRAHKQESIDGDFLILRKMPTDMKDIKELGLPDAIKNLLLHEQLNGGGLVIICGEPGNGKSTTTAAVIRGRLSKYGGFCLTLENPVEMPLHGKHGDGYCIQTPVEEGGFESALSSAMRCYPTAANSILFLGEVRSSETAAEALRIANNGHLVITTLHSSNVVSCLKRLLTLAKTKSMSDDEASALLAGSLKLVLHQKLVVVDGGDKKLAVSYLFSQDNKSPTASRIRAGGIDNLVTEVEQQNIMLKVNTLQKQLDAWDRETSLD
jgi:Tfp pilus assembly pilus retraction ATPase PilT